MENKIKICSGGEIVYAIRKSKRAKRARLTIYCDGRVVVTIPWRLNKKLADRLVTQKANWILKKLAHFKQSKGLVLPKSNKKDYLRYKIEVGQFIKQRINYFNQNEQFLFKSINIKNQKTRWGSCSAKKNLNFNYRIIFLPKEMADYIIIH